MVTLQTESENVREPMEGSKQDPRQDEVGGQFAAALARYRTTQLLQQIYPLLVKACSSLLPRNLSFPVDEMSWESAGASPVLHSCTATNWWCSPMVNLL